MEGGAGALGGGIGMEGGAGALGVGCNNGGCMG